jgi:hypothetical protein
MPRKTPRPAEEARAIARALRRRYITPEAEIAARRQMARLKIPLADLLGRGVTAPSLEAAKGEKTLIAMIRDREGIELPASTETGDFTMSERERARQILEMLTRGRKP